MKTQETQSALLRARTPAGWMLALALWAGTLCAEPGAVQAPWREVGLSEREAAAHVLDRLAYGARPGDVDEVVAIGVDRWLQQQIFDQRPAPKLETKLENLVSLELSSREMGERFPTRAAVLRQALEAGVIEDPELSARFNGRPQPMNSTPGPGAGDARRRAENDRPDGRLSQVQRAEVLQWARKRGLQSQRRAVEELGAQKIFRARYAEDQLREVLSDFWLNHFNVSTTDPLARVYVWPYERDAIRPHVLGRFRDMLEATAKHPAMLHYLDNATSVARDEDETTLERRLDSFGRRGERMKARLERRQKRGRAQRPSGLNENYARELMELHTLGVDGGYDQQDVIEVARAFTGWTTFPAAGVRASTRRELSFVQRRPEAGFVVEDAFIFRADTHDAGVKSVLGRQLVGGRGIEDGLEVLDLLADHPSTAQHIARKLAIRFISDSPPPSVVDRLAKTFTRTDGDLQRMMVTLVQSPEFWGPESQRAKIKSPLELAISAVRAVGAEVSDPRPLIRWIERMGQPLYAYQAPTGYPDRAEAWVNTGALLHRMNFGLQFATGGISGLRFDLLALNGAREPASLEDALQIFLPVLLPERDTQRSFERLVPVVRDPRLAAKIAEANQVEAYDITGADTEEWETKTNQSRDRRIYIPTPEGRIDSSGIAHVVGVILGSPEFQRR